MASEEAQVAGLCLSLSFRLQIGQFDTGMEGITPCAVALKLHLYHLRGSLAPLCNSRKAYILSRTGRREYYGPNKASHSGEQRWTFLKKESASPVLMKI